MSVVLENFYKSAKIFPSFLFYLKTLCASIYISIIFSLLVKSYYSFLSNLEQLTST